jgi:putative transposase
MSRYEHGTHTTHRLKYHLVWIPKYRKRVLQGPLARRLYELLRQCSEVNDWPIDEMNVQIDHIHMLVQLPPSVSVSKAVQTFKGGTSRRIREEFPELEEFLWGESLWAAGFFAESVGQVTEGRIKLYIKNQRP